MKLISISNLEKRYEIENNSLLVFRNLNIEIKEKEFLVILGPNGCGKTTLLNIIAGFEKPTKGSIFIKGKVLGNLTKEIGFVFQDFSLYPWKNVFENVMFGLDINKVNEKKANRIVMNYLKILGLEKFKSSFPYQLSAGMKQKVALARTLAVDPSILLMDEPLASIDNSMKKTMRQELIQIWKKTGKTFVYVTHSIEEALHLGTRIIVMNKKGEVIRKFIINAKHPRNTENPNLVNVKKLIKEVIYNGE